MEKEIRSLAYQPTATERIISGYALKFNTRSELLSTGTTNFHEIIMPCALTQEFIDRMDVVCLYNHSTDLGILARSKFGKGSLTLKVDSVGLFYSFRAKHTSLSEEILQAVAQGDITSSSFSFTVPDDGDTFTRMADGNYLRRITKFSGFFDVSPVVRPAYKSSTVTARNLAKVTDPDDLTAYYARLKKEIDNARGRQNSTFKTQRECDEYFQNLRNQYK